MANTLVKRVVCRMHTLWPDIIGMSLPYSLFRSLSIFSIIFGRSQIGFKQKQLVFQMNFKTNFMFNYLLSGWHFECSSQSTMAPAHIVGQTGKAILHFDKGQFLCMAGLNEETLNVKRFFFREFKWWMASFCRDDATGNSNRSQKWFELIRLKFANDFRNQRQSVKRAIKMQMNFNLGLVWFR